jgi:hypothetical protein
MSDLTKILLSAGVGLVAGLISGVFLEPFKAWYLRKHAMRRAYREIYEELRNLYDVFCVSGNRSDEAFCHSALKSNPPDTFDYYYQQHREACFLIPGWRDLKGFFEVYKVVREIALERGYQPKERPGQNIALAQNVAEEFESRFKAGQLDKARIVATIR